MSRQILVEIDAGRLRTFASQGAAAQTVLRVDVAPYPQRPLRIGRRVVFAGGGWASYTSDDGAAPVNTLGPADRVIAGMNPGQVWLVQGEPPREVTVRLACVAQSGVSCSQYLSPVMTVPDGWRPVAAAGGMLVVERGQADTLTASVWDPAANRVVFDFPPTYTDLIDAHGNELAWLARNPGICGAAACELHLADLAARTDRVIVPPAAHVIRGGAFSPSGATLAAFVAPSGPAQRAQPVLIDVGTGKLIPVAGVSLPIGESVAAAVWAPSGEQLFLSGISGSVIAWDLVTASATTTAVPASYAFTVL